ncbi:MAG: hypothetical protein H6937_04335 [Burkholderiales bacterium]|nr:hypothetical protein [Burkholderiales bacterium]MDR4517744.1 hypothetical protein [Nitrosomonas sp.]
MNTLIRNDPVFPAHINIAEPDGLLSQLPVDRRRGVFFLTASFSSSPIGLPVAS